MLRVKAVRPPSTGEICPICLDDLRKAKRVLQLPCNHYFHCSCFRKWEETSETCPICRRDHFFQYYHNRCVGFYGHVRNNRYFPSLFNRVLCEFRYCVRKGGWTKTVLKKARRYMVSQDVRWYYNVRFDSNRNKYIKLKVV